MTATAAYQQLRDYSRGRPRRHRLLRPTPGADLRGGIRGRGGDGEAHRPY